MITPWQPKATSADDLPALKNDTEGGVVLKVKFVMRAAAFCASVVTLSWFFEGWRRIHQDLGFWSVATLIAGILCTTGLIVVQAFWIYVDEKQKGSLLRRIPLFDKLYEGLVQRKLAQNAKRGENTRHA